MNAEAHRVTQRMQALALIMVRSAADGSNSIGRSLPQQGANPV